MVIDILVCQTVITSELLYQPNIATEYICCHKSLVLLDMQRYIKSMKKYGIRYFFNLFFNEFGLYNNSFFRILHSVFRTTLHQTDLSLLPPALVHLSGCLSQSFFFVRFSCLFLLRSSLPNRCRPFPCRISQLKNAYVNTVIWYICNIEQLSKLKYYSDQLWNRLLCDIINKNWIANSTPTQ